MLQPLGPREQTPAQLCHKGLAAGLAVGLAAWLGDVSCQLWGSLCCVCAPREASHRLSDRRGHPQRVTALVQCAAWHTPALHPPLCVAVRDHPGGSLHPPRVSYQEAASGDISLPAGTRVWGEGQLEGQGEPADAAQASCTGSAMLFLAADNNGMATCFPAGRIPAAGYRDSTTPPVDLAMGREP